MGRLAHDKPGRANKPRCSENPSAYTHTTLHAREHNPYLVKLGQLQVSKQNLFTHFNVKLPKLLH